jgi:cell division protein FtsN
MPQTVVDEPERREAAPAETIPEDKPARSEPEVVEREVAKPAETVEKPVIEPDPAPPTPRPSQPSRTPGDPLLLAPGSGWSLHPWSFPDSNEALSALGPLIRQGMKPAVRGFVLEERGRWYRVLVGRFTTRAQALEARERLTEIRGIDWVGVVQVP